jgi:DNA helicase-2/ATP-dependent DNA helicase PcrA
MVYHLGRVQKGRKDLPKIKIDFSAPTLVTGGAGTGKTTLFCSTLKRLIFEEEIPPENIVGITRSSAVAARLREEIERKITPGYRELNITTFTSLAGRILQENRDKAGVPTDFEPLTSFRERLIMRELLIREKRNLRSSFFREGVDLVGFAEEILDLFGFFWSSLVGEEELEKAKRSISSPAHSDLRDRISDIILLISLFEEELSKIKELTYRQLVFKAVRLISENEDIRRYYRDKFRYILVDEFQDTDLAQLKLIYLIAGNDGKVVAFGDPEGIIFRFRGSDPRNISGDEGGKSRFEEMFRRARRVKLNRNYRLFPSLFEMVERLGFAPEKAGGKKGKIAVSTEPTRVDEAFFIARAIKKLVLEGNVWGEEERESFGYKDIAILLRNLKNELPPVEEALSYFDIPYQVVGYSDFFLSPEVKFVVSYLKALAADEEEFGKVLSSAVYSLDRFFLLRLIEEGADNGYSLFPLMEVILRRLSLDYPDDFPGWAHGEPPSFRPKLLSEIGNDEVFAFFSRLFSLLSCFFGLKKELFKNPLSTFIRKVMGDTGILQFAKDKGREDAALAHLGSLILLVDQYDSDFTSIHQHPPDFSLFVSRLPELLTIYGEELSEKGDMATPKVNIMSIHRAKGLEFPLVFVPCLVEGDFPRKGRGMGLFPRRELLELKKFLPGLNHPSLALAPEIADEKRLFLTAITRAKDRLFLSHYKMAGRAPAPPSRFLREAIGVKPGEAPKDKSGISFFSGVSARSLAKLDSTAEVLSLSDLEGYLSSRDVPSSSRLMEELEALVPDLREGYIPDLDHLKKSRLYPEKRRVDVIPLSSLEITFTPKLISDFIICPRRAFFSFILRLKPTFSKKLNWRRVVREAVSILNQPHRREIYLSKLKDNSGSSKIKREVQKLLSGLLGDESSLIIRGGERWRVGWHKEEAERALITYFDRVFSVDKDYRVIASSEEVNFQLSEFRFSLNLPLLKLSAEGVPLLEIFEFNKDKGSKKTTAKNKIKDMVEPGRGIDFSPLIYRLAAKARLGEEGIEGEPIILYRFLRYKGEADYSFPGAVITTVPVSTEFSLEEDYCAVNPEEWREAKNRLIEICRRIILGGFPAEPGEDSIYSCLGYFGCPYEDICGV